MTNYQKVSITAAAFQSARAAAAKVYRAKTVPSSAQINAIAQIVLAKWEDYSAALADYRAEQY